MHCMQELLEGYNESGVVYLDLECYPTNAVTNPGPGSCIAGQLKHVPGLFGMPSQACSPLPPFTRILSCCVAGMCTIQLHAL